MGFSRSSILDGLGGRSQWLPILGICHVVGLRFQVSRPILWAKHSPFWRKIMAPNRPPGFDKLESQVRMATYTRRTKTN